MKLNLGSHHDHQNGFLSVDMAESTNPDILCDIEKGIPVDDSSVSEIKAFMILEHIDDIIFVMNEIHRILQPNGTIDIIVPHDSSAMAHADPTHKRIYNEESFGYFCSDWHGGLDGESNHYRMHEAYGITANFKMLHQSYTIDRRHGKLTIRLQAIK